MPRNPRSRLLALIAEHPNIHVRELRAAIPEAERKKMAMDLSVLHKGGWIVRTAHGRYRKGSPMPAQKDPTSKAGQLRSRLLALIADRPNVHVSELREAIGPDASRALVVIALAELQKAKQIERASYGRYRIPLPARRSAGAGQIMPLHRLMAGR